MHMFHNTMIVKDLQPFSFVLEQYPMLIRDDQVNFRHIRENAHGEVNYWIIPENSVDKLQKELEHFSTDNSLV